MDRQENVPATEENRLKTDAVNGWRQHCLRRSQEEIQSENEKKAYFRPEDKGQDL